MNYNEYKTIHQRDERVTDIPTRNSLTDMPTRNSLTDMPTRNSLTDMPTRNSLTQYLLHVKVLLSISS